MVGSIFDQLLSELGTLLKTPLKSDRLNVCQLSYKDGVKVQLELDKNDEQFLIATKIGTLTPGKFREEFLEQALKANALPTAFGTFAFAKHENDLVYFHYLPLKNLTGQLIFDALKPFLETTRLWKKALNDNVLPQVLPETPQKPAGMFGIR